MGDRTWLYLTFRKENEPTIAREFYSADWVESDSWYDEIDEEGDWHKTVHFYESNYANYSELETLTSKNIPFIARHGSGGDYSGCLIASFDGKMYEQMTDVHGEGVVRVGDDGVPVLSDVESSVEFATMRRLTEKFLEMNIGKLGFYGRIL